MEGSTAPGVGGGGGGSRGCQLMQPHSGLRAPLPLPEPGGGWLTDSARDSPKLGRGSGFKGRVASLGRCLPLRPRAGSPSARRGTRGPQRSWCAPGPSRGSPTARAPEGLSDRRAQEAGTAGRWEVLEPRGVSRGSRTLRKPRIRERPPLRWTLRSSGFWMVNGLGSLAAQGFSRPGAPRKSAVARAARKPSAPQHPHRGTASALRALTPAAPLCPPRSLGKGGDTKAPRRSQSGACFLGRRGDTSLRSLRLSQSAPGSARELWEL